MPILVAIGRSIHSIMTVDASRFGRFCRIGATALIVSSMALLMTVAPAGQGGDTTPPMVTAHSPTPGATGVSTLIDIKVAFNEPIQPATLSFVLRNASSQVVASQVTYDASTRTATLHPNTDLAGSQQFTATVSGAQDLAGNVIVQVSWSFTTAASQFSDQVMPQTGHTEPTVIEFASDGRMFVADKSGRVWTYDNLTDATPTLVVDLRINVYNFWDRGMLGMALHPQFPTVPYLYVLYSYDAVPGGVAPRWGTPPYTNEGCPSPTGSGCVITGRLTRVNIANPSLWPLGPADEQPLITDWPQQFPSHSVGSVFFGSDGALYVTGGEGASFNYVDYGQTASTPSIGDPPNEGGALRSQDLRTTGDPVGLDGTLIRVDPDTGAALPDNPRYLSDSDPNGKRIVAHGFRNPFRAAARPGTREIWVGDVGYDSWEEINRIVDPLVAPVSNYGWPCYEGEGRQGGYSAANLPICQALYNPGDTAVVQPFYTYAHGAALPGACAPGSSSISGLAFVPETGGSFPTSYRGALFFADYSRGCIWAMRAGVDGLPNPADIVSIQKNNAGPVHLTVGPGADIFYPGFDDGRVHRLRYAGNLPPTAAIQADQTSGPLPLTVNFSAGGSTDPENQTLTYAWDLNGDGAFDDSTARDPQWTYTQSAVVPVRVLVTDSAGLSSVAAVTILANQAVPVALIDTPGLSATWRVGDVITFSGHATDPDVMGNLPSSALSWEVIIQHCPSNCHTHSMQTFTGVSGGSFTAPDHEYPSYLQLRLTATDATGLQSSITRDLHPQTVSLTFQTSPAGLQVGVNAALQTTPFSRTVIIGSSNSVSAPTQSVGSVPYQFSAWSDGLAANHNIIAPATSATYTATFTPTIQAPGLIAAYNMDESSGSTIIDWTGKGHVGTLSGTTRTTQGKYGSALQFNGTNNLVTIADAADLDLSTGLTLEAWVNPSTLSGWRTVAMKEAPPSRLAYSLYAHDNAPRSAAYVYFGGDDVGATSTSALPLNVWSHLAMTFDGSTIRLYRDGVLAGSRAGAGSIIASTGALRLGGNNIWGEWFAGRIDDVRIYNRALSVSEIASDMNTPVGGPPPPDTTAPVASVTAPANNALVRGAVSVTATASDNVGVTSVQFLLDGNALGAPDTTSPYSVSWDTTLASNATHTLAVRAVDAAGNPGTSASLNVIVDNLPPAVAISSPAGGTTVSGTVTVSATATDLNGIANVQFRLDGANLGSPDTTSPYSVSWNTVSSTNGSHTLSAIGADSAGNQTTAQNVMVTVSNIVDTTPPSVSVTSPAIGATVSGTVTVTAGASDTSGITSVQFLLDGNPLGAADTTAPYSASWNTTQSTNGSHTLSARATDGVGLTATSSGVGITVNNAWTVPSGLVAAYTFSEGSLATTADASGAGLNGTITGATWTTSGRFGNALSFNGLSDWVTVADSPALRFTSGMTIEAWVYPTAIGGGAWRTVVMKEAAGDLSYTLYADDSTPSRPAGYINRGGTHVSVTGTAPLPLNTWSHIAVTYGGGNLRFFLNGTQLATRAQTGNISTSTNPLRIGGNSPWGEFFTGRIDEVRLYNRALTAAEIAAGMNQTVGAP